MSFTLDRRMLLRGVGRAAVALPLLDAMGGRRARAEGPPKMRYLVAFAGCSPMPSYPPKTLGTEWELTPGLQPLGGRAVAPVAGRPAYSWDGVKDAFSVVSNLRVPTTGAGSYRGPWHSAVVGPLLSGVSSSDSSTPHPRGITSDQVVSKAIASNARFKWLGYRVQPTGYRGNDTRSGIGVISHDGASLVSPVQSPRAAYDQFFRDFTPPAGSAPPDGAAQLALAKNRSVLDLVSWNASRLQQRLGSDDRARLSEHFNQIRELERRLGTIGEPAPVSSQCARAPDPGADPADSTSFSNDYAARTVGYSKEHERALVMGDLIYMAFTCGHARVASLMFTYPMCFMTVQPIIGNRRVDLHDLGHGGGNAVDMARATSWHVEHIARLADRLRKTREGDGNLLDSTVIVFLTEGGTMQETHSSERACVLIGGGKAGGLVQGRHVDGRNRHPANVLVSAMNAAGVNASGLGEIEGRIGELHV